ncbi:hypothetical protein JOD24_002479 [Kroppenstedtia sanguinis]
MDALEGLKHGLVAGTLLKTPTPLTYRVSVFFYVRDGTVTPLLGSS